MKRREFIASLASATMAPFSARGQQTMPVVGYLGLGTPASGSSMMAVVRRSLAEAGFVEGRSVMMEPRWADGQYDKLPVLAAELVRRPVTLIIATGGSAPAVSAKAATGTIPIVFSVTDDPVALGLVASFARPGSNATGVNFLLSALGAKHLGLLRELVPGAKRLGLLVNSRNANAEPIAGEVTSAAAAIGMTTEVVRASDIAGIETAFATLMRARTEALIVASDPFFYSRRVHLATLSARHAIPAIFNVREFAEAGGLMSYGTSLTEVYRQVGNYAARILKGSAPSDLPVVQSITFELVINRATARTLGIEIPATMLARADEVIE